MAKARMSARLVACSLAFWLSAGSAWAAAPTVAAMLNLRPKQNGVIYSTPTAQEQELCKVELVSGARQGSSGWLLRDPQGRILRRFFDSNGDKHIDIWSYYLDGVEVYREVDSNFDDKIDQYRWLNAGGTKWGLDRDQDGKIDYWKIISAEEVSQEILQAFITKDFDRLQTLWINDAEMQALELPQAEITRINDLKQQASSKFQSALAKIGTLSAQTRWERLESAGPQCVPADQTGMKKDLVKYHKSAILYENNGKHEWIQTGEMIQVGMAWRLIDVPVAGDATPEVVGNSADPAMQALLDELRQLDSQSPKGQDAPSPNSAIVTYNMKRAEVLQKILVKVKAEDREQWIRQLADCLSAAAQSSPESERAAYDRLLVLAQQIAKGQPGSPLAAYVTFREMSADYAGKLGKPGPEFTKVQEQWLTRLAKFVQDYPRAEDAPDALLQLGMVSEFLGKEPQAKKWYQMLAANFADKKPLADKAEGALRRLDLEGKQITLAGSTLGGGSFDINQVHGKIVIVYYWASWNQQSVGDFARLKLLLNTYAAKGVELVCVNLDSSPPEANSTLDRASVPGVQLFAPGGLDSPLATQYGIMVLPNMFLVDKNGNVISRTVQLANLEDEIKKAMK
jgi:hypothetical protein